MMRAIAARLWLITLVTSTDFNMPDGKRFLVGKVGDIAVGERKVVTINGREIGVFNVNGTYHALLNRCPHRGAPLCHGRLRPLMISQGIGQLDRQRDNEILKCPWHQWEFDIKTGRALYDDKLRVRTYAVTQEGDEIVLYW